MEEFRQIELSEWTQVGEGGNGKTYVNSALPDVILKVNREPLCSLESVRHEYEVSKAVERLGLNVPKMFEIVRVGRAYATLSERINGKQSLSRICCDEPQRIEEIGRLLCEKSKELSLTPCDTLFFPSRKEQLLRSIESAGFVSRRNKALVRSFAESIPDNTHCVHGDFQTGNIIKAGDSYYWIDLDRFAYGDPMFDVGHLFQICQIYAPMKQVQDIFHLNLDQFHRLWDSFASAYTGRKDHTDFDRLAGKFACIDVILRPAFSPPSFAEKVFFGIIVRRLIKRYYL